MSASAGFTGEQTCTADGPNTEGHEASVIINIGPNIRAEHGWDQDSIDVATSANGETLYLAWGGGDECVTVVTVNGDPVVDEGCPAGNSPGAPNPGWGHLTPATP